MYCPAFSSWFNPVPGRIWYVWLSRVKSHITRALFFRDKAIQSEINSRLLTNSHWVRCEREVHNFSHKTKTKEFQKRNPRKNKHTMVKEQHKDEPWTKHHLHKTTGEVTLRKFNSASQINKHSNVRCYHATSKKRFRASGFQWRVCHHLGPNSKHKTTRGVGFQPRCATLPLSVTVATTEGMCLPEDPLSSDVTVRQYGSTVPYGSYAYLTYRKIEVRYL